MKIKRKLPGNKHFKILSITTLVALLVNLIAWLAPKISEITGITNICNLYVDYVLPVIVGIYGRITGLLPFSVGEVMIVIGIWIIIALVIVGVLSLISIIIRAKSMINIRKKILGFLKGYSLFVTYVFVIVFCIMTLNCVILYHCDPMVVEGADSEKKYTIDDLEEVRNYIVTKCNELSKEMVRDENGNIIYDGDINEEAKNSLRNISGVYGRLSGYYSDMKPIYHSGLMTQAGICGYFFPFSMETNYNSYMYITRYPSVFCHEMSHIKGYIYEDEANFVSFLACTKSDDTFFKYSGYLSILYYVDNAYYDSLADKKRYYNQVAIEDLVYYDKEFVPDEIEEKIEEDSFFDGEAVDEVSDKFTDTTLKLNGVSDGMISYSRVVELVLQYYKGR